MDAPVILLKTGFITDSDMLFERLMSTVVWDERMKARKTASFGVAYEYSGMTYPQTKMHPDLIPVCKAVQDEVGFYPNNCLLNYYPDGNASMGYHSDNAEELAPDTGVVVISLGAERSIFYRSKQDKTQIFEYPLYSGAMLYMSQAIQDEWLHAIPKQSGVGPRISITLRDIIK